ncbi:hypothetical protein J056_001704 [Wallemia ichthyophaga EXF-994]|uniref:Uncharacterized protein n=1 Tax=Wallemia ichthyophaga (strain EXF-994 / CBS 113033) TaxID=1299270 RepID=R9AC06_WALI9|nr:uncharacterized protein J056_001704 [Wallemia ichthyophaga EXF-994]EOQ99619.1 hypothetical protein J056_001704 [Wallemia ichthyophaga EXF-994]
MSLNGILRAPENSVRTNTTDCLQKHAAQYLLQQ